MSFQDSIAEFSRSLQQLPNVVRRTAAREQKAQQLSYVGKDGRPKTVDVPRTPTVSTRGDTTANLRKQKTARIAALEVFGALPPRDRRKISALVRAARSSQSVSQIFVALSDGDFSGSGTTEKELRDGIALAQTQGVDLDADVW